MAANAGGVSPASSFAKKNSGGAVAALADFFGMIGPGLKCIGVQAAN
jgi:hypothetical protein